MMEPNPWCVRVWDAMTKGCGPDCKGEFVISFITGWPAIGSCKACTREWLVHQTKTTPKKPEGA
jgi:hypothetical protein